MIRKFCFIIAILSCMVGEVFAQQIPQSVALKNATDFYRKMAPKDASQRLRNISIEQPMRLVASGNSAEYFVYNIGKGNGFVIASGDERLDPIVLYTQGGSFEDFQKEPYVKTFLDDYSKKVAEVRDGGRVSGMRALSATPMADIVTTGSLIETRWDQERPYNLNLNDPNGNGPYYTGCVATGLSQILKYHNFPASVPKGTRVVVYTDPSGKKINYNSPMGQKPYAWGKMLNRYPDATKAPDPSKKDNEYNEAVAHLMQEVGASVRMQYGYGTGSGSSAREAARVLIGIFGYSNSIEYASKKIYTDTEWASMLRAEIDGKRPILQAASGPRGDHVYVCDGYSSDGKFSYNMGWGTVGAQEPVWTKEWGGMGYNIGPMVTFGIAKPGEYSTIIYQVGMHTSLNLLSHEIVPGGKFDAKFQVTNYGMNEYRGDCALGLYQNGELKQVLAKTDLNAPKPINDDPESEDGKNLVYVTVRFTGVTIPADVVAGRYTLRTMIKDSKGAWRPMLAEAANVYNNVAVSIAENKEASITYPTSSTVSPLTLVRNMDIAMSASNIGTARFSVTNVDSIDYKYNGKIYVLAQKVDSPDFPEVVGSVDVLKLPLGETRELSIGNIVGKPGRYIYYVAYSPSSKDGSGIGAVPLLPASKNFYKCSVPEEKKTKVWNFKTEKIPADFKLYENDIINDKIWGSIPLNGNALSFFGEKSKESHTLVTSAIDVPDDNAVLEWTISAITGKGIIPYEIYISTVGQDIANFKGTPAYRVSKATEIKATETYRTSLAAYKGQKIYVAVKHFNDVIEGFNGSGISVDNITLLDIQAPKNVSLMELTTATSCAKGDAQDISIVMKNRSPLTFNKIKASYSVDGGTPVVEEINREFKYDISVPYTFKQPLVATEAIGTQRNIEVKIELEGEDPGLLEDNKITRKSQVMSFVPRKNFFIGKYTTTSCTGCRLSSSFMNQFEMRAPSTFCGVEVWNNTSISAMETPFSAYSSWGTPMFTINGTKNIFPLLGSNTQLWIDGFNEIINKKQIVGDITTETRFDETDKRKLHIKLTSRFALPVTGKYYMTAYIIENGVKSDYKGWYNHIPIGVTDSGIFGKDYRPVITNPQVGELYVYETVFNIPEQNGTRYNLDNVQVIGLIFDENGSVENSSVDLHYVRFKETSGLTFEAEPGFRPFFHMIEQDVMDGEYKEAQNIRATVKNGENFQFRIQKTGAYVGKTIRVMNNKTEEIYPDATGLYSLNNIHSHSYLTVEESNKSIEQNGTNYIIKGEWTTDQLNELTFPATATAIDLTNITIPECNPIAVGNPNCIFYVLEAAVLPTSWNSLPNIVRGNLADKVVLEEGYNFGAPKEFTATEISYTADYSKKAVNEWTTLTLPFNVPEAGLSGIIVEQFISIAPTGDAQFERVKTVRPNTPYAIKIVDNQKKTFNASSAVIPVTPIVNASNGFKANYALIEGAATAKHYSIAADGKSFALCNATSKLRSFTGYILNSETAANSIPVTRISESSSSFSIINDGVILGDDEIIDVNLANITDGELEMKFSYRLLPKKDMEIVMKREVITAAPGQRNEMCLDYCYPPEANETNSVAFDEGVERESGSTYARCFQPIGSGVTSVRYTFVASERGADSVELSFVVNYHASTFYSIENEGSSLVLSGNWQAKNFRELDFTMPELTSIDMTSIAIPTDINELNIANPNCLIYASADATTPSSWKNVVKGDKAEFINLFAGNNFTNLKPFTTKSMQVEYDLSGLIAGEKAMIVLPFEYSPNATEFRVELYRIFDGSEIDFNYSPLMKAYYPYLLKPIVQEKKVFKANDVIVPLTTDFTPKEHELSVTWVKRDKDISDLYALSKDGKTFDRIGANSSIKAWSTVLKLPIDATLPSYLITNKGPVGVNDPYSIDGLSIVSRNGVVTLRSDRDREIYVIGIDGRIVRHVKIEQGTTELHGLDSGIYIINTQKVHVMR